jgi:hypothetical protein
MPVTDGTYLRHQRPRIVWCSTRRPAAVYERQRLTPSTDTGSPVLADGKIYITNEDGGNQRRPGRAEIRDPRQTISTSMPQLAGRVGRTRFHSTDKAQYAIGQRRRNR